MIGGMSPLLAGGSAGERNRLAREERADARRVARPCRDGQPAARAQGMNARILKHTLRGAFILNSFVAPKLTYASPGARRCL